MGNPGNASKADGTNLLFAGPLHSNPIRAPPSRSLVGSSVGGYTIVRELGSGGMGVVFLAQHAVLGTLAAVKTLRPELASQPEIVRRFVEEARATARIRHPNSVEFFDLTHLADGRPGIVMEYLEGTTLEQRLAQGPLTMEHGIAVLLQVCSALAAAHVHGITHRDVKPQNIMLVPRDGVEITKLLDFGLAKSNFLNSRTHGVIGTPHYMAPEQIRGEAVDPRADVYAAGVVAYLLLAGRVPFNGQTIDEILAQQLMATPTIPPAVPAPFHGVLLRSLAKAREDRYPAAGALGEALHHAWIASLELQARATSSFSKPSGGTSAPAAPQRRAIDELCDRALVDNDYEFLEVSPDADDLELMEAVQRLELGLDVAFEHAPTERLDALKQTSLRLHQVRQRLLKPAARACYDAELGNVQGVAQCIRSGLPPVQLMQLHRQFAEKFPERVEEASQLSEEAQALVARGEPAQAVEAALQALVKAPLSLKLHRQYRDLRKLLEAS